MTTDADCYLPVEYIQKKALWEIVMVEDFSQEISRMEFRTVLLAGHSALTNLTDINQYLPGPSGASDTGSKLGAMSLLAASDVFMTPPNSIKDLQLNITGSTFKDSHPQCHLIGGNLLWSFESNFEIDPAINPDSPLTFFSIYVSDWAKSTYRWEASTLKKYFVFTSLGTDSPTGAPDFFANWALFAVTKVGKHRHLEYREVRT